ncbi:KGG domain-containing protein [Deinococcus oregonensis]|uniref:KGG domain-containing protein n=1 Tax=Deinococcus oregonensis TaxID=1805970 RepID=A0ABV6AXY3_9DEIO
MTKNENGSDGRGFAGMDPEQQREIASQGAKRPTRAATRMNLREAREAGRKGGEASGGNQGGQGGGGNSQRGGSSEQHAEAGRQSHKND